MVNLSNFYIDEINFEYPESYEKLIDLGLVNFDIWFLMEKEQATSIFSGMQERYPNRKLIPFAKRADNDDTACFEVGKKNKIQLIHDFATEGFEQRGELEDLWEWVKSAVETMVAYNREEDIV